jgi:acyl-CoA-dependent ceramide synthase
VGPYFVSFVFIWGYMRHYINLRILYSLSPFAIPGLSSILPNNEFATVGNYVLDFSTQQYKCWISQAITFPLLAALQAVNLFWYFLIWRILYRIVFTGVQKDDRSDDEEEDEDEEVTVEARTHKAKISGSRLGPPIGINGKPLGGKSHQNGTLVGGETTGIEGVGGRKSTLRKKR